MEPIKPVVSLEALEVGADDDEGPIHYTISHNRLEVRDLSKDDITRFKHLTVCLLRIRHA